MRADSIGPEAVRELCRLAKLELEPAEEARLCEQIGALLAHFAALQEVPTDDVEPSPYPLDLPLRTRADTPAPPLDRDALLANAPAHRAGQFQVPRVVDS